MVRPSCLTEILRILPSCTSSLILSTMLPPLVSSVWANGRSCVCISLLKSPRNKCDPDRASGTDRQRRGQVNCCGCRLQTLEETRPSGTACMYAHQVDELLRCFAVHRHQVIVRAVTEEFLSRLFDVVVVLDQARFRNVGFPDVAFGVVLTEIPVVAKCVCVPLPAQAHHFGGLRLELVQPSGAHRHVRSHLEYHGAVPGRLLRLEPLEKRIERDVSPCWPGAQSLHELRRRIVDADPVVVREFVEQHRRRLSSLHMQRDERLQVRVKLAELTFRPILAEKPVVPKDRSA